MYIQDLRPGEACPVKVIYGPGQRAPTTTGRDNLPGPTPSAGAPQGPTPSESTPPAQDPPARLRAIAHWSVWSRTAVGGWRIRGVSSGRIASPQR